MNKSNKPPNKPLADRHDPLLRELEEEIRRERYAKLWEKYGVYVLAGAAAFVVAVGGYQFWEHRRTAAANAAGADYERAATSLEGSKPEDSKTSEALKSLETLARSRPQGYAALARLQLAGAHLAAGRTAEAVTAYQALASDSGADPILRDFARLQAAAARMGDADWTEMQNRLNELMADGNPWQTAARELWGLAAMKAGQTADARDTFTQLLADKRTPPDTRERVSMILSTLVAGEDEKTPEAPAKPAEAAAPAVTGASPPVESGKK